MSDDTRARRRTARHGALAAVMAERGWTQSDMGRHLGVSPLTVGLWFRRKTVPILRHALRMRDEFGIPIESWAQDDHREVLS